MKVASVFVYGATKQPSNFMTCTINILHQSIGGIPNSQTCDPTKSTLIWSENISLMNRKEWRWLVWLAKSGGMTKWIKEENEDDCSVFACAHLNKNDDPLGFTKAGMPGDRKHIVMTLMYLGQLDNKKQPAFNLQIKE